MKYLFNAILIAIVSVISLTATAQKPTTPIQLNNYLASFTDTLYRSGQVWGNALNRAMETKKFAAICAVRIKMEQLAKSKLQELKVMEDINGSRELRLEVMSFLEFELNMIRETFIPFEKLNAYTPQQQRDELIENLLTFAEYERDRLAAISIAQVAYGKLNGFTIESSEEEDN